MTTTLRALILPCIVSFFFFPRHCLCFTIPRTRPLSFPSSLSSHGRAGAFIDREEESPRRRVVILSAPAAVLLPADGAANAAVETPAEAIRVLSAKTIPGLGPPDVYYPPYFVGRWRATRVVTSSDDVLWEELKQRGVNLPVTIVSEMRFVPYDAGKDFVGGDNPNGVPAVADRSFNERSYYTSLSSELDRLYSTTRPRPSIRSLDWTRTNPNVLSLSYSDGSSREVKVTKRSSDVSGDGGVFSSEFRRITAVPPSGNSVAGGIPSIFKSRVLAKWKRAGDGRTNADGGVNLIEGIEIVYNEQGTLGRRFPDPLQVPDPSQAQGGVSSPPLFGSTTEDLPDWRSTKTKILMERIIG